MPDNTLWWGFRKVEYGFDDYSLRDLVVSSPVIIAITGYVYLTVSANLAIAIAILLVLGAGYWGTRSLSTAIFTTIPIVIVIIWLYAIIAAAGYGLNMVTVAIAAMSLGVGIDYVIHVVERYREERATGADVESSIKAIGGAAGLALFGSAVSDVTEHLHHNSLSNGLLCELWFVLCSNDWVILIRQPRGYSCDAWGNGPNEEQRTSAG